MKIETLLETLHGLTHQLDETARALLTSTAAVMTAHGVTRETFSADPRLPEDIRALGMLHRALYDTVHNLIEAMIPTTDAKKEVTH